MAKARMFEPLSAENLEFLAGCLQRTIGSQRKPVITFDSNRIRITPASNDLSELKKMLASREIIFETDKIGNIFLSPTFALQLISLQNLVVQHHDKSQKMEGYVEEAKGADESSIHYPEVAAQSKVTRLVKKGNDQIDSSLNSFNDRLIAIRKDENTFLQLYFKNDILNPDLAKSVIATVSYISYLESPDSEKAYKIFNAEMKLNNYLFSFDNLRRLDLNRTKLLSDTLHHYGLMAQMLIVQNSWGDTIAHKDIFSRFTENARIHLEYASGFSNKFLKKYLYELKNYQQENWLDDMTRMESSNALLQEFLKIINFKKLEHLMLLPDVQYNYKPYIKIAAEYENTSFVMGILNSIAIRYENIDSPQRVFNLTALEFAKIYSSQLDITDKFRSMGIVEYRHISIDDKNFLKQFAHDEQNVHHAEFTTPLVEAVEELQRYYQDADMESQCASFKEFFYSIGESEYLAKNLLDFLSRNKCLLFSNSNNYAVPDSSEEREQLLNEFFVGAERVLARILNSKNFSKKYDPYVGEITQQTQDVHKSFKLTDALVYSWMGLSDPAALDNKRLLNDHEILERKLLLPMALYDTYKEGVENYRFNKKKSIEDVVMDAEPFEYKNGDIEEETTTISSEKIKGVICVSGLFDRMIHILDQQHRLVKIKIKESTKQIDENVISERFYSIENTLLESPLTLSARIYDNFEFYKGNSLLKKFLPTQQYLLGKLKMAFNEQVTMSFFGGVDVKAEREDFVTFEDVLLKIKLSNPVITAINDMRSSFEEEHTDTNLCVLLLKIFLVSDDLGLGIDKSLILKLRLIDELASKYEFEVLKLSNVLNLSIRLLNQDFFHTDIIEDLRTKKDYVALQKFAVSIAEGIDENENVEQIVTQTVEILAAKHSWNVDDLLKFQLIVLGCSSISQEDVITALFYKAVLRNNCLMLKEVISYTEDLQEKAILSNKEQGNLHKFINKYLILISEKDISGFQILHIAAKHCKPEILEILLNYHEFRDKIDTQNNVYHETPLYIAIKEENYLAADKLIEYGADLNLFDRNNVAPIHLLASQAKLQYLQDMLSNKYAINAFAVDNVQDTFVHKTAWALLEKKEYHIEVLENDLEVVAVSKDILCHFLLPITERFVHEKAVMARTIHPEASAPNRFDVKIAVNPLEIDNVEMFQALLNDGKFGVNSRDELEYSPIIYATIYHSYEILDLLINNGANPFSANVFGDSALSVAVGEQNTGLAKFFLSQKESEISQVQELQGKNLCDEDEPDDQFYCNLASSLNKKSSPLANILGFDARSEKTCFLEAIRVCEFLAIDTLELLGASDLIFDDN